jgi:hypothetical protein
VIAAVGTDARKRDFARRVLGLSTRPVVFVDVGAGGALKHPWTLLPADRIQKIDIEPDDREGEGTPRCASDRSGRGRLFVARDPRSSSLHRASEPFVRRFGNDATVATHEIEVDCITLDALLGENSAPIDLLDVNAEGHDLAVLGGAAATLAHGVSLIKVEVLFTEVWYGQGWFADIDRLLRAAGYDLVTLAADVARPAAVRRLHHDGEIVWGKAHYVPSPAAWSAVLRGADRDAAEDRVLKAVALYGITGILGRAAELIALAEEHGVLRRLAARDLRRMIDRVFAFSEVEARLAELARPFGLRRWAGALTRLVTTRRFSDA